MANDSDRYGDLDQIIDQVYNQSNEAEISDEVVETDETEDVAGTPVGELEEVEVEEVESVEDTDEVDETEVETDDKSDDESDVETEDVDADGDQSWMSKLVTVKVNGEEMQVSVDQAIRGFQIASAANAKFEEAAKIRREAQESVEFRQNFEDLWSSDPSEVIAHFVSIAPDPNALVEAAVLRAAALGKLNPQVAEALGLTEQVSQELSMQYQRQQLEQERAALESQRQVPADPETVPDEHGFTVADYRSAITEIVKVAGLDEATAEEKRAYVEQVFRHGDENDIKNPYLAFAAYQRAEARLDAERTKRVQKAVQKVAPATKTAAALNPKGQVQHSPTAPVINSSADAAEWALEEIQRKYGAL
jgi:hypothetical protein